MAEMRMTIWNVEDGNSISLELPNGKLAMIDAHATSKFSPIMKLYAKGFKKVDWLVVTHPHTDHLGDIPTIKALDMGPTVLSRPRGISEDLIRKGNSDKTIVDEYLDLDRRYTRKIEPSEDIHDSKNTGGVDIEIFTPESRQTQDINDYSRVVIVSFCGHKILCMGDCTPASVKGLLNDSKFVQSIKGADVLIAPHHGHESCYCSELFDSIAPKLTVISDDHAEEGISADDKYREHSRGLSFIKPNGEKEDRFCLTTRFDGDIFITISDKYGLGVSYNGRRN